MLITRNQILTAAFECFFKDGFDRTSLESISKEAGVTRGAIYWHFSDKETLYRKVVDQVLEKGDVSRFSSQLPDDLSLEQRLSRVFWTALDQNRYVDFVFMTMNYVSANRNDFQDLWEKLADNKLRLYQYLNDEVQQYVTEHKLSIDHSKYAAALFLLFEGLFLSKNISEVFKPTEQHVEEHIRLVLSDLL